MALKINIVNRVGKRIADGIRADIAELLPELDAAQRKEIRARMAAARKTAGADWAALIALLLEILKLIQGWTNK